MMPIDRVSKGQAEGALIKSSLSIFFHGVKCCFWARLRKLSESTILFVKANGYVLPMTLAGV